MCTSMSNAASGRHRNAAMGLFCRSAKAHESDKQLSTLFAMLRFFLRYNPNLIFIVENPVGQMKQLPYIKKMEEELDLKVPTVHYCRFGMKYLKPTHLWTNVSAKLW